MEREVYGVVLTAGSQIKRSPVFEDSYTNGQLTSHYRERIEPDREGKMRFLSGLDDLQKGKISRLLIAGGAKNHGIPLSKIYLNYAKRFLKRYNLPQDSIQQVLGGTNTLSDLDKTKRYLEEEELEVNLNLYSSSYHLERKSIRDFLKKFKNCYISFVEAEDKIEERHRFYGESGRSLELGPVSERILTSEFVETMRTRNKRVDLLNRFHATWIVQTGSYLLRR